MSAENIKYVAEHYFKKHPNLRQNPQKNFKILPLRTLDEFILGSAKFQIPHYQDPGKWSHRVKSNLFYYQTNYILTSIVIFLIFLAMYTTRLLSGLTLTISIIKLLPWFKDKQLIHQLAMIFLGITLSSYLGVNMSHALNNLTLFWICISTMIFITLVHASLRLRNLNNKYVNFTNVDSTPMSILINTCVDYLVNLILGGQIKMPAKEKERLLTEVMKMKRF